MPMVESCYTRAIIYFDGRVPELVRFSPLTKGSSPFVKREISSLNKLRRPSKKLERLSVAVKCQVKNVDFHNPLI